LFGPMVRTSPRKRSARWTARRCPNPQHRNAPADSCRESSRRVACRIAAAHSANWRRLLFLCLDRPNAPALRTIAMLVHQTRKPSTLENESEGPTKTNRETHEAKRERGRMETPWYTDSRAKQFLENVEAGPHDPVASTHLDQPSHRSSSFFSCV
jgi:hypothetical protein